MISFLLLHYDFADAIDATPAACRLRRRCRAAMMIRFASTLFAMLFRRAFFATDFTDY